MIQNQGKNAAIAHILAGDIHTTREMIAAGNTAAFDAVLAAGVLFYNAVYVQAGTFPAIRELVTGNLKRSKDVNEDFVERTISSARRMALWLNKTKPANILQSNSLADAIATLREHLHGQGVKSRKAVDLWLKAQNPPAIKPEEKPTASFAEKACRAIEKERGTLAVFEAEKFGRLIGTSMSFECFSAFVAAAQEGLASAAKARADAASLAAAGALDLDLEAPAFAAAG